MKKAKGIAKKKKPRKKVSELDQYVINQVKRIRKTKKYTQASLSFELHRSDGFIAQIESNITPAHYNISHLNELAKILKCSIYEFFPKDPL